MEKLVIKNFKTLLVLMLLQVGGCLCVKAGIELGATPQSMADEVTARTYVVVKPQGGGGVVTITASGIVESWSSDDGEPCEKCEDGEMITAQPEPVEGEGGASAYKYYFGNLPDGASQEADNGPKVTWEISSNTAPGNYEITINYISEDYACPDGFDGDAQEKRNSESETINIWVITAEFITPAGDPVSSPQNSGDGKNQFVFDDASSGVFDIEFKARVIPANVPQVAIDKLYFVADPISGSTRTYDNGTGQAQAAGGGNITGKATFTGLPSQNSEFGKQTAYLLYNIAGKTIVNTDYEVFYSSEATNHPGANAGTDPNWFYYYKQAAGGGSYTFYTGTSYSRPHVLAGAGESGIKFTFGGTTPPNNVPVTYEYRQVKRPHSANPNDFVTQFVALDYGAEVKYYLSFLACLAHEKVHANEQTSSGNPVDIDDDKISNNYELNGSDTDPQVRTSATSFGTAMSSTGQYDGEMWACGPKEHAVYNNFSQEDQDKDWASPGMNY